jgi:hypothetical protein
MQAIGDRICGLQFEQFTRMPSGFERFNFYMNIVGMNMEAIYSGFLLYGESPHAPASHPRRHAS